MEKNFKYHFDSSLGILFKYYYGATTIRDIESSWEYAFKNGLIPREVKGFILDYRKSTFDVKIDEYMAIPNFYQKHIDIFGDLKIAILTEDPKDIVVPILVELEDEGYLSKPFTTLESAIKWVLS
jgi:hypothetical protein